MALYRYVPWAPQMPRRAKCFAVESSRRWHTIQPILVLVSSTLVSRVSVCEHVTWSCCRLHCCGWEAARPQGFYFSSEKVRLHQRLVLFISLTNKVVWILKGPMITALSPGGFVRGMVPFFEQIGSWRTFSGLGHNTHTLISRGLYWLSWLCPR